MRSHAAEFGKFIATGIISTIINYAVFYGLYRSGINYLVSASTGFGAGVIAGYAINKTWTFSGKSGGSTEKIRYAGVYLGSLGISVGFLFLTVDRLGIDPRLANIASIGITTITNFIGTKFLVFKNKKEDLSI